METERKQIEGSLRKETTNWRLFSCQEMRQTYPVALNQGQVGSCGQRSKSGDMFGCRTRGEGWRTALTSSGWRLDDINVLRCTGQLPNKELFGLICQQLWGLRSPCSSPTKGMCWKTRQKWSDQMATPPTPSPHHPWPQYKHFLQEDGLLRGVRFYEF